MSQAIQGLPPFKNADKWKIACIGGSIGFFFLMFLMVMI